MPHLTMEFLKPGLLKEPRIFISVPGATYQHHPAVVYNFNYSIEQYRGLDFIEDLFNHGTLSVELKEGEIHLASSYLQKIRKKEMHWNYFKKKPKEDNHSQNN